MSDHQSILDQVQRYYGETLTSSADLRTDACCDGGAVPESLKPLLADIHPEVSERYYGCGLVAPDALEGLRVLDLGCGAGRDVYLLSRLLALTLCHHGFLELFRIPLPSLSRIADTGEGAGAGGRGREVSDER